MKKISSLLLATLCIFLCFSSACTSARRADEAAVTMVVDNFGKKLGLVSLLSPTAAQDIQTQYAPYVAPALLAEWVNDPSHAPGKVTSSPWPDRIEIASLTRGSDVQYQVTGNIIEVTSVEVTTGGAAATIPVQIVVEKIDGQWLIASFEQSSQP